MQGVAGVAGGRDLKFEHGGRAVAHAEAQRGGAKVESVPSAIEKVAPGATMRLVTASVPESANVPLETIVGPV